MKRGEQIISGRKTVRTERLKAFTMKATVVTFREIFIPGYCFFFLREACTPGGRPHG